MKRLSRSKIEYVDYCWNFYPGCRHWRSGICPVPHCWARDMETRFRAGFEPHLVPDMLFAPLSLRKPSKIGVCFTGDLFGDWVKPERIVDALFTHRTLEDVVKGSVFACPEHQFLFLTKRPDRIHLWGKFPSNAWLGASVCSNGMMTKALTNLAGLKGQRRWLSFEPLLGKIGFDDHMSMKGIVDWCVIGAQSRPMFLPDIQWVLEIVEACDQVGIPVFQKNNLKPLLGDNLRQEFPEAMKLEGR